jgi:hypothetical protein
MHTHAYAHPCVCRRPSKDISPSSGGRGHNAAHSHVQERHAKGTCRGRGSCRPSSAAHDSLQCLPQCISSRTRHAVVKVDSEGWGWQAQRVQCRHKPPPSCANEKKKITVRKSQTLITSSPARMARCHVRRSWSLLFCWMLLWLVSAWFVVMFERSEQSVWDWDLRGPCGLWLFSSAGPLGETACLLWAPPDGGWVCDAPRSTRACSFQLSMMRQMSVC